MNILFISNLYPQIGDKNFLDGTFALHQFVREWAKNEHVVVIKPIIRYFDFRLQDEDYYIENVRVRKVHIFKVPKIPIFYYQRMFNYLKKINIKFDIIIGHCGHSNLIAYKVANRLRIPLMVGLHQTDIKILSKITKAWYLKKIIMSSVGVVCRSDSIYNRMLKMVNIVKQPCFIANSGVSKKLIEEVSFSLNKLNELKLTKKVTFITCAQLIKRKNIDINLKVLSKLNNIEWIYYIVGEGKERKKLEKLTEDLGIYKKVKFFGQLPWRETIEIMKTADIYVMVSAPETFGLAYLEAMAKGCVVIGAKGYGIDGIIINGKNGYLCEPRNVENLYNTLNTVLFNMCDKELESLLKEQHKTINGLTDTDISAKYLDFIKSIVIKSKNA